MNTSQCLAEFKQLLTKNYPTNQIPEDLIDIIACEIRNNPPYKKTKPHDTIKLQHFSGFTCNIDKNIAELIKYIWLCNIDTNNSCEDNVPKNYIWIQFASASDLQKFLNIVFKNIKLPNDIYNRATEAFPYRQKNAWIYNINIDEDEEVDICDDLFIHVSLRFPKEDYKWICSRFKKYLKNNNKLLETEYIFLGQFFQESSNILISNLSYDFDEIPKKYCLYNKAKQGSWNIWIKKDSLGSCAELITTHCSQNIQNNHKFAEYNENNYKWTEERDIYSDFNKIGIFDFDNYQDEDTYSLHNGVTVQLHGIVFESNVNNLGHYHACLAKEDDQIIGIKILVDSNWDN